VEASPDSTHTMTNKAMVPKLLINWLGPTPQTVGRDG